MTENLRQLNRKIVGAFLVGLVFSTGVFFWDLGVSAIANADEGVHALVTREIRERPDWLTMHIRGETYFRKPPLAFWIRAVSQSVFGENEFATRLPSALAGVATTVLLALWAWQWTRRWQTVAAVGVIFPLLPSTFVHTFRTGETDGTLIFLLTLTAYILWHSLRRPKLLALAGLTTGLALMTKSVAAGVVPIGFLLTLVVYRRWPYTWKQALLAAGVFFVIAAPWHVIEHVRHGSAFWNEYLGEHVVERVEERLHVTPKTHGPWWYLTAVERGMYPWAWLIIPAALIEVQRRKERADETGTFLIMWGFGTIVLFSLAATKLAWYVAPAFPALSLLVAGFIARPWRRMETSTAIATAAAAGGYAFVTQNEFQAGWSGWLSLSFVPALVVPGGVALIVLAALARVRRWSKVATALI
ncbi:MAG: glycosyltransferase family 39 protein, partial [Candidatus Kerfeldbacteria bacterium]|nr:glycosyltransferase family 39 protein [Candidatus Kerfeldbacteria bacterium]